MRALVFLSVLSLTACVAGPNFVPPKAPATERFTSEELPNIELATRAAEAGATPGQEWWTAFRSTKLNETVQMALDGNRRLKSAQATLQQAREIYNASRGARLPDAEVTAMNARNKYGAAFLGGFQLPPFTAYSVGANVNYLLDFAGGVRRTIEEQRALAEVREHEATAAHLSLTGNVVLEALRIASARARIRAAESILEEDSRNVELVRKALDEGSVARVDLLTAQSQLAQDQTLLPPLRQELSAARHALAVLVGQPPGNWSPPDFELEDFAALAPLPVSLPSELARRRPDIRASEAQLHAATAAVGVAAANLYPQITLTGSLSQQALKASDLFDNSAFAFGLSGNLTAPLFNGGRLRAERRAAEAARQAALANYEETVLTAFRQVADVLAAIEHDTELATAQQQALDVAENNLRLTRESYSAGNVGVLQILEAERAVQSARIGAASATAQRLQDTAELIVALGGDSPLAPAAATASVR
ncbi:MAG TPA: efflux transporter outer membrane subunit [Steroidobacteraceae bacterium]|nr:efflux transporter outer membrane subunit [Steroidobacteraceae bacterium]